MSRADELVDALLDGGEVLDEGGFTIDGEHARTKLGHGLADPDAYVVVVVRAALLRGATTVDICPGWTRTRVSFDGRPLRDDELSELASFRQLASDQPGDAASRRALTQAVRAAVATGPTSGGELDGLRRPGLRARILSTAQDRLRGVEIDARGERPCVRELPPEGWATVVEVDHPRRLARIAEILVLATPEHRWTRHALVFAAPARLWLTGQRAAFRGNLTLGTSFAGTTKDLRVVGLDGLAAPKRDRAVGWIALVVGGVKVASKPLPSDLEHIKAAIVRDDALRLDASGFDVVADRRWDALLTRLHEADARWTELPDMERDDAFECESWRLDPIHEQPARTQREPGGWPNDVALITALFLPGIAVMDFGAWVYGLLLVGYLVPLLEIANELWFLRDYHNRRNFEAHLPTGRTLLAGLVHSLGVAGCLIRLLHGLFTG